MKENTDLIKFRNRYFVNNKTHANIFDNDYYKYLIDILFKAIGSDCPDGYFYDKNNSILYIFEHFEFDCSPNRKSGSKLRENSSYTNKQVLKEMSNSVLPNYNSTKIIEQGYGVKNGKNITYYIGQDGDKYRDNYINNFKKIFNDHTNKLDNYIKNCKNIIGYEPLKIITTFLIEDITLFGTYYKENNKKSDFVNLLTTQQFFNEFISSKIDYVIFGSLNDLFVDICDKDTIKHIDLIDLTTREFYIIPAAPLITFSKKN